MKTAEEFLKNFNEEENNIDKLYYDSYVKKAMIEFAKMHVQEALKQASEKTFVTPIDHEEISEGSFRPIWGVDDESILNAYSLENIK